jgi:signal transduction histidine kinase
VKKLRQKRLQLQLLFALIAALAVVALTIGLVLNAVQHAQSFVLADADRTIDQAMHELSREYRLRLSGDTTWKDLTPGEQDLTLRAISRTVLNSYPGVEGGFWNGSEVAGYAFPTHDGEAPKMDVPAAERASIEQVSAMARTQGQARRVLQGKRDLVVIGAQSTGATVCWAMKRLPGLADPAERTRNTLLISLVGIVILGAGGVLATGIGLNRGVAQIKQGLASLDRDFGANLPERRDELGEISAAINRMARTRQRLEAELRREDRTRVIGQMTARMAHEIRNPLNSIRLSLQMLAQRQQQKRLMPSDFEMVINEVDRLNRLLSDLLAFQQPRPPKIESREVGPLLQKSADLVRPQAEKQGVQLVLAPSAAQSALFDEQYLQQIMVNLLLNAVEVSAPGDRVAVQTSIYQTNLAIEVRDNGPGLSGEQQEHLFEPFYTTKTTGHGLGLAVSRELAESMGGILHYEFVEGPGARFVLRLKGAHEV